MNPNEILERAAASYGNIECPIPYGYVGAANDFFNGAKWQAEHSFSKEDMVDFALFYCKHQGSGDEYWGKDLFQEWQNEKRKNLINTEQ